MIDTHPSGAAALSPPIDRGPAGRVAVIDARGRGSRAAQSVESAALRGPVLVLADTLEDAGALVAAGATHFLIDPCEPDVIALAVRAAGGGLPQRSGLATAIAPGPLHRWLAGRLANGASCAVAAVALSRLDLVNAAHGRSRTDAAISAVLERLSIAVEGHAIVARAGGEHVLLAMEDGSTDHMLAMLGEELTRPVLVGGARVMLGSRVGVATPEPGDDAEAMIRRAYQALHGARGSDGATIHLAEPEGVAPIDALAVDLHLGLSRGEIGIVFQPQVEVATGRIVGVEALARWEHPRWGPLGAATLFAAAERADLGIALSDQIQALVLSRAAAWPRALGALRLSLNLTAADVARRGFAATFLERVDASGFPRGRLTVELTETGMIREMAAVAGLLAELRAAGCRIAIDDFGTGYSSLAYLKALPLDYVKLDKALVDEIAGSPRDRVVVRGVIDIARALGLAVIAEGVETPAQLALLSAEGCGWYQGFLCAGPLREDELVALVEQAR